MPDPGTLSRVTRCGLLGHRYVFTSEGSTLNWSCDRGCGAGGSKRYRTDSDAARYAAAFDRKDADGLGHRAPLIGLLPLRLWRALTRRG